MNKFEKLAATGMSAAAIAAGSLAMAGTVEAASSVTYPFHYTVTEQCPGFDATLDETGTETVRYLPNSQQNEVKLTSTLSGNGESYTATTPYTITFSPDTVTYKGITSRFNVPGEGVVALEVGVARYDEATGELTFDSGPSQDTTNVCDLLAQ